MSCCLLMGIDNEQQGTLARSSALQQKRFLSIHEYLSANLLKTVGTFSRLPEKIGLQFIVWRWCTQG